MGVGLTRAIHTQTWFCPVRTMQSFPSAILKMNKVFFLFAFCSVYCLLPSSPMNFTMPVLTKQETMVFFQQYPKDLSSLCHHERLPCYLQFSSRIFFLLATVYDRILSQKGLWSYAVWLSSHYVLMRDAQNCHTLILCERVRLYPTSIVVTNWACLNPCC